MRGRFSNLFPQLRLRRLDQIALLIVLGYALLAFSSQSGASVGGRGLDPVLAEARQRGVLRVAVDFGFYPFSGFENDQPIGYDIDLATAVAEKLGLDVVFVPSNVESIYEDLASGNADLAASALPYAPQQGWRATFSEFYFNAGQVLIVPEGSPITGQSQLGGSRIGAALGSDADTYARRLAISDSTIRVESEYDFPAEALDDLRRGRLDAVIVDNASALSYLSQHEGLALAEALTLEPYALAMSSRAYQLHEQVNRALEELRAEGFFEELGARWFR